MKTICYILSLLCIFQACGQGVDDEKATITDTTVVSGRTQELINSGGQILGTRIRTPKGFEREKVSENSFAKYLRQLPLKPHNSKVELYNGLTKENDNVYDAVVDLQIGEKNLHQCADAIIRLRAEYLYKEKLFNQIHFNLTNGFRVDYTDWMKGKRVVVKGNKTYWTQSGNPTNTYEDFWNYLELVFTYAGTISLSKELNPIDISDLKAGDVFIQQGSPGHAVIIVDVAVNPQTKDKIFLLAQSYMPAQEIQILRNPDSKGLSSWYSVNFGQVLETPEWTFHKSDLKRFSE